MLYNRFMLSKWISKNKSYIVLENYEKNLETLLEKEATKSKE
jgi:hypothetical protein